MAANLRAHHQDYGPRRWRELSVGPASSLDGPTLCVALRRQPTTEAEANELVARLSPADLRALYDAALCEQVAHAKWRGSRERGAFVWSPLPDWPDRGRALPPGRADVVSAACDSPSREACRLGGSAEPQSVPSPAGAMTSHPAPTSARQRHVAASSAGRSGGVEGGGGGEVAR